MNIDLKLKSKLGMSPTGNSDVKKWPMFAEHFSGISISDNVIQGLNKLIQAHKSVIPASINLYYYRLKPIRKGLGRLSCPTCHYLQK